MKKSKYSVGYGKPPKHSRFKPGQSGNPKGRPKGARGFKAELDDELRQLITVTEAGRTWKLNKRRAIIKSLIAKALKGDPRALQLILSQSNSLSDPTALQPTELDPVDQMILDKYARKHESDD
ncbi:DUF5681 domain-containing protein [Hyphomicrobium sp. ghe19]|uniref:DUF5681 domain-containing protein n=1 Tax=Hyphomicrobium sp. ghe19 TaxID=2682968 RepID=UPI001367648A|nr:hypothetical protein HYPP_03244 [Hyphomicrobium sp. ghe19]